MWSFSGHASPVDINRHPVKSGYETVHYDEVTPRNGLRTDEYFLVAPGWMGESSIYMNAILQVAQKRHQRAAVITHSLGFGLRSHLNYDEKQYAKDCLAVMDDVARRNNRQPTKFVLNGHSNGGVDVAWAALAKPKDAKYSIDAISYDASPAVGERRLTTLDVMAAMPQIFRDELIPMMLRHPLLSARVTMDTQLQILANWDRIMQEGQRARTTDIRPELATLGETYPQIMTFYNRDPLALVPPDFGADTEVHSGLGHLGIFVEPDVMVRTADRSEAAAHHPITGLKLAA